MSESCLICDRIDQIKQGTNPFFVKELKSGYVVIGDTQLQHGYTLFLYKNHVRELHDLKFRPRHTFMMEMTDMAWAVQEAFQPNKLNYELLGNTDEHMHWHIIPRYDSEAHRKRAYWSLPKEQRNDPMYKPTPMQISLMREQLLKFL